MKTDFSDVNEYMKKATYAQANLAKALHAYIATLDQSRVPRDEWLDFRCKLMVGDNTFDITGVSVVRTIEDIEKARK